MQYYVSKNMIDEHVHPDSIEKHCCISDKYIHKLATSLNLSLEHLTLKCFYVLLSGQTPCLCHLFLAYIMAMTYSVTHEVFVF